jgi:hypothetical protein
VALWALATATCVDQELVCGRRCAASGALAGQHGGKLDNPLLISEALDLREGAAIYLSLRDSQMNIGLRRHLRQMCDTEDLVLRRDAAEASTEGLPRSPTETSVNLVKDQGTRFTSIAEGLFDGE